MRATLVAFVFIATAAVGLAQTPRIFVFPVEAIADSATMDREAFKEAYPGIEISGFGLSDEGWYVRYQHELLTYLYGPIYDLDEARRQKALMEEIRLNLVLKKPKLTTSAVDLIEFRFDPADSAAANRSSGSAGFAR